MSLAPLHRMDSSGKASTSLSFSTSQDLMRSFVPFQQEQGEIEHLIGRRSTPGVIILGRRGVMFFSGGTTQVVSKLLKKNWETEEETSAFNEVLMWIRIEVLKREALRSPGQVSGPVDQFYIFQKIQLLCRGLLLNGSGEEQIVMVLVENVPEKSRRLWPVSKHYDFTPRERSVLHFVKKGFTNKEIANALSISTYTIKDHLRRIMKKLNVHTRSGIVGKINIA